MKNALSVSAVTLLAAACASQATTRSMANRKSVELNELSHLVLTLGPAQAATRRQSEKGINPCTNRAET